MIRVEGLSVRLGGAEVLHEVSLTVERGTFLVVIGPNGAGKSTLLRCLDGIIEPTAGRVLIDGRPLGAYRRRELARALSYVPQPDAAARYALGHLSPASVAVLNYSSGHLLELAFIDMDRRQAVFQFGNHFYVIAPFLIFAEP